MKLAPDPDHTRPARRAQFVTLSMGFGHGQRFLATWAAWRADPQRSERLVVITIEPQPLTRAALIAALAPSDQPELAAPLIAAWPPATPDLHLLDFDAGRVQLRLAVGEAGAWLPALQAEVNFFDLGEHAPTEKREIESLSKQLARLAAPGATLNLQDTDDALRAGLAAQGFEIDAALHATYRPRFRAPPALALRDGPQGLKADQRHALIIGGGLAGCAAARALARQGWHSTVLDRQPSPAMETSGNAGGLMHGIFNQPDSLHSRWFRAAALRTTQLAQAAVASGRVQGRLDGFLRLENKLDTNAASARLLSSSLPTDWLQWRDQTAASTAAGWPLPSGGWWFASGGWLAPAQWAAAMLAEAQQAGLADWRGSVAVSRVTQDTSGDLQALDAHGNVIAQAPVLVLAGGLGSLALCPEAAQRWPMSAVRGQTTVLTPDQARALGATTPPGVPLAGQGYALALPDGRLMLGATSQHDDSEPGLRAADHLHNLRRAAALGLLDMERVEAWAASGPLDQLDGRVGWRAITPDRLPVVGPLVDAAALQALRTETGRRQRLDAARHLPRLQGAAHGLYVMSGLGSRGITSAALAGELLAGWISGAPCPVAQDLRDALDVARFCV